MDKHIEIDLLDFEINELNAFERYVLSLSPVNDYLRFNAKASNEQKKAFNRKIEDILLSYAENKTEMEEYAIYLLRNPLLRNKVPVYVMTGNITDTGIEIFLISKTNEKMNNDDIDVYSKELSEHMLVQISNKAEIAESDYVFMEFIDNMDSETIKRIRERELEVKQMEDKTNIALLTEQINLLVSLPGLMLDYELQFSMQRTMEWLIGVTPNAVFAKKRINGIIDEINQLSRVKEIDLTGNTLFLREENGAVLASLNRTQRNIKINGIKIGTKETVIGDLFELENTGIQVSYGRGKRIDIKIRFRK